MVQWLASRLVWPYSDLTVGTLLEHWPYLPVCLGLGAAMVYFHLYGLIKVGQLVRVPLGRRVIEIPAGLIGDSADGESWETAALRELEEETGWRAEGMEKLTEGPV